MKMFLYFISTLPLMFAVLFIAYGVEHEFDLLGKIFAWSIFWVSAHFWSWSKEQFYKD